MEMVAMVRRFNGLSENNKPLVEIGVLELLYSSIQSSVLKSSLDLWLNSLIIIDSISTLILCS